jgi:hypothetical protein
VSRTTLSQALTFRGYWSGETIYWRGDVVLWQDYTWIAGGLAVWWEIPGTPAGAKSWERLSYVAVHA